MHSSSSSHKHFGQILKVKVPNLTDEEITNYHEYCFKLVEVYLKQSSLKRAFTSISSARNELKELAERLDGLQELCNRLSLNAVHLLLDSGFRQNVVVKPAQIAVANAIEKAIMQPNKPTDEDLVLLITKLIKQFKVLFSARPASLSKEFISEILQCLGPDVASSLNKRLIQNTALPVAEKSEKYTPIMHIFNVGSDISRQYKLARELLAWSDEQDSIDEGEL